MQTIFLPALIALFFSACAPGAFGGRTWNADGAAPHHDADESKPLRITVFDVGQGDSTLIESPSGETILIDGGPPGAGQNVVLPHLESQGIEELSYIIVTHYHEDHMDGIPEVLDGPDGRPNTNDDIEPKGEIYDRGTPALTPQSPAYGIYESRASGRRHAVSASDRLDLGDCYVEIVAANGLLSNGEQIDIGDPPDENASSIAVIIEYGGFKMFLGADITGGGLLPPYTTPDVETPLAKIVGDIDILRVAHHGSASSTNAYFLDATTPEVAIISLGDENEYFHPHRSVIERLLDRDIQIYQTERGWNFLEGPIVRDRNIVIDVLEDGKFVIL